MGKKRVCRDAWLPEHNSGLLGFQTYCQATSLHGWRYLIVNSTDDVLGAIFWIVMILFSIAFSVYFTWENLHNYMTARTITSLESTTAPLTDVAFPSLYLCNLNQISASYVHSLGVQTAEDENKLLNHFVYGRGQEWEKVLLATFNHSETSQDMSTYNLQEDGAMTKYLRPFIEQAERVYGFNQSEGAFEQAVVQECSDQILRLKFAQNEPKYFYKSYLGKTDMGICCWLLPSVDFTLPGADPNELNTPVKNGLQNGYEILLDTEAYDYSNKDGTSTGLKVSLGHPMDKAVIQQDGFHVSPGTETLVAISASILNTTEQALRNFSPDERDCYTDSEFRFRYLRAELLYRYSIDNCLYEAVTSRIEEQCGCTPSIFFGNLKTKRNCVGSMRDCVKFWLERMGSRGRPDLFLARDATGKEKQCRVPCQNQKLSLASTMSVYPNERALKSREDYCNIAHKILKACDFPEKRALLEEFYENDKLCNETAQQLQNNNVCPTAGSLRGTAKEPGVLRDLDKIILQYAMDNIVMLKIYFKEPFYTRLVKDQSVTFVSFVANAGGLVGLCMGLSFISVVEVFYHLASQVCKNHAR